MKKLILFLLLLLPTLINAQNWKRTQNWYFGDSAGLSFATDPPTILTDGAMYALEGCATISDTAGNLLFYTNGLTVWNKNHQVMLNGTGLLGHESSAQAALIVPQPGNDSVFFIFTTGGYLRYSVVNLNKDGGKGEVVEKNNDLIRSQTEKLAATHHANGNNVWVVTHGYDNNHFYSFLVTKNGVTLCPVVSQVGSVMSGSANQAEMRFSPSGRLACVSFWSNKFCELVTFNNRTGSFNSSIKIFTGSNYPSGFDFSIAEDRLYTAEREKYFVEYKIDTFNETKINSSRKIIYSHFSINNSFLSWKNKIYFCLPYNTYLGYLVPPVHIDSMPRIFDSTINVAPKTGTFGFPNFISSYFKQSLVDFRYENNCTNTFDFVAYDTIQAIDFNWTFVKNNQLVNSANGRFISYTFPDTGNWEIRLVISNAENTIDSIYKSIIIGPKDNDLGSDTIVCSDSLILDAGIGHCYKWSDHSTDRYLNIKQSGSYSVKVITDDFCELYDTINVLLDNHPVLVNVSRIGDTLKATPGFKKYQWYRNDIYLPDDTSVSLILKDKGRYKAVVSDNGNCIGISTEIIIDTLTSVHFTHPGRTIRIYPNPSTSEQGLSVFSDDVLEHIQICSPDGKLIREYHPSTTSFQISDISAGAYFLTINHLYHFKIIIH